MNFLPKSNNNCKRWDENKSVDPTTNKSLLRNGHTYLEYTRKCRNLGKLSGDEPEYIADMWNHPHTAPRFNCYDYAFNNRNTKQLSKTQPGELSGLFDYSQKQLNQCNWLHEMMKSDHPEIYVTDFETPCKKGFYKIASVVDKDGNDLDYHFLRQDDDGIWSHKPGAQAVTRLDASEVFITDPSSANFKYTKYNYDDFCGYHCIPKDSKELFKNKKLNVLTDSDLKKIQAGGRRKSDKKPNNKSTRKPNKKSNNKSIVYTTPLGKYTESELQKAPIDKILVLLTNLLRSDGIITKKQANKVLDHIAQGNLKQASQFLKKYETYYSSK